jgi:3-oxoacyl-(acyl-carrier-protein) synthase
MAYDRIKAGKAKRMLAGSTNDHGPYIWAGFDAMKVMTYKHNDCPEQGSRPMSASASGFVPGSGAGALVLESLESALERNINIYAEVIGGSVNSGGQRGAGTMTAPNSVAVRRCISQAVVNSGISAEEVDAIDGHLTATSKDFLEIENWAEALQRKGKSFPYINSLKSMTGHCLSATGAIECVAVVLELNQNFLYPSLNCEDIHPEIEALVDENKIPRQIIYPDRLNIIAKAGFGFGDVNACIIFNKYN